MLVPASLVPLLSLAVVACGPVDDAGVRTSSADREVVVEVDAMSGVPNPTWPLAAADVERLAELVASLPEGGLGEIGDVGLGFRGFVVTGLDLSRFGDDDRVRVTGTTLLATSGRATSGTTLLDQEGAVYALLRSAAESHLDASVMQAIPVEGEKSS